MDWLPEAVIEAMRGSHQLAVFFRLDIDPPLRLWMGINDVPAKIKSVDGSGAEYVGAGRLIGIPELEVLINGVADRIDFTLSGVTPDQAQEVDLRTIDIRGKDIHVALTVLDDYYQPIVDPIPVWTGRASFVAENVAPVSGMQSPTIALALSAGAGVPSRERVSASLWSDAQQQALYPGDLFCAGTARLARGVSPSWPRF